MGGGVMVVELRGWYLVLVLGLCLPPSTRMRKDRQQPYSRCSGSAVFRRYFRWPRAVRPVRGPSRPFAMRGYVLQLSTVDVCHGDVRTVPSKVGVAVSARLSRDPDADGEVFAHRTS